ncbi:MAG TPA: branched-chain amino acid ABC transporter permease [Solirubrobacter sp.]|nr:branched-chain amino acid ABC transporter permease [Solirubrobacter sp.]
MLQYLLSGLGIGCVYGLVALGFALTYQAARFFNFAHGAFFMLGAMGAYALVRAGVPVGLAVPGAALVVGAFAVVCERLVFRRFVLGGQGEINTIVVAIGLASIIRGVSVAVWGPQPQSVPSLVPGDAISLGGAVVRRELLVIMVITAIVAAALFWLLQRTRAGVAMRATADDLPLVGAFGIDVRVVLPTVLFISGLLAGIAGALVAPVFKAQPVMDVPMLIKGLAAAILGGLGNPWGALVGGLCLGVIESFGSRYGGSSWADVITYAVILVMLVMRPEGLLGKRTLEKA